MKEQLKVTSCPSCGELDVCSDTCLNPRISQTPVDSVAGTSDKMSSSTEASCPTCTWVFITTVPGSQVLINGTKADDGLLEDTFMITFQPAGEKKPHPIILDALHTDFGIYATRDPKIATVLMKSIAKGNAQYHAYNPEDPCLAGFDVKAYLELPLTETCPVAGVCC